MPRLYEISAGFLPESAMVVAFDGHEALNRPYRFQIRVSVPLADGLELGLDGATGQRAKLTIHHDRPDAPHSTYSGTVAAFELVEDLAQHSIFRLDLVPKLWGLSLGEHSRVFIDMALPDILEKTLQDGGLSSSDFELRLTGKYPALPHVCQIRESRLVFLTRWLERVGAYYFFEQGDDGEKLILTDSKSSHSEARTEPVRFVPQGEDDVSAGEALRTFRWRHEVTPRRVTVTDYDPLHPQLAVTGSADATPASVGGDVHFFKVNEDRPERSESHAKTRALEYLAGRTTCQARGRVFGLMPGFVFDLVEHPRGELNKAYLVTEIVHRGSEARVAGGPVRAGGGETISSDRPLYECEVKLVDASQHLTPPSLTPWPRISGTVRARIDGSAESEFAQLDGHGRYLVRILLDESGLPDGAASTRLRMLQPHAGNPEGMHLPLRKGTEVQVGFLRGDPDQPVIVGVTPNKATPSPVVQANHSQNVLQTGGLSRIEIEDKQGSEYVDISTPPEKTFLHLGAHAGLGSHNYVLSTSGDTSMHTGGTRDITVGGKQNESVKGNVNESYHADQETTVDGSLTETIDGGATQTIHAGSTQTIDGGVQQTISGGELRTVDGGQQETLSGGRTQTITGSSVETISGDLTQTISGGATISTPAGYFVTAAGGFEVSTPASMTMIATGGFNLLAPGGQRRLDSEFQLAGGEYRVFFNKQLTITGHKIDAMGLYVELIGVKVDVFGLKHTISNHIRSTALAMLTTDGIGMSSHAFSQHKGGFHAWGG